MNKILKNKTVLNIFKVVVSIVLIGYIIGKLNIKYLYDNFSNINFFVFFLSILFINVVNNVLVSALKLRNILQGFSNKKISFYEVAKIYFYSTFFGLFLPTNFGGDGAKCVFLEKKYKEIPRSKIIFSVLLERVTGLVALLFIMLFSLFFPSIQRQYLLIFNTISEQLVVNQTKYFLLIIICVVLIIITLYFVYVYRSKLKEIINSLKKIDHFSIIFLSFLFQLIMIGNNIYSYYYFSGEINIAAFFIIIPITILLMMLPISFQGIGLRDGLALLLFPLFFVNPAQEKIISYTLTMNLLIIFSALIGGLVYLSKKITNFRDEKNK